MNDYDMLEGALDRLIDVVTNIEERLETIEQMLEIIDKDAGGNN